MPLTRIAATAHPTPPGTTATAPTTAAAPAATADVHNRGTR
jgi:hypothetical protein